MRVVYGWVFGSFVAILIAIGVATSPSDAERIALDKAQNDRYEARRNNELQHTPGMEDCTFHYLDGISAIRCPNSTTTTNIPRKGGSETNTTVDGDK